MPQGRQEDLAEVLERYSVDLSESEIESQVSLPPPPPPDEKRPQHVYTPFSLWVITLLMPTAVFGLLARLGLEALSTYEGTASFPLAWSQLTGCFVMGLTLGLKDPIADWYPPMYTAITTGFCGSLTTFSSWERDTFLAWANTAKYRRNWLRDVVDGLTRTVFTLLLCLSALMFGIRLARSFNTARLRPRPIDNITRYTITVLSVLIYTATIPAYIFLPESIRFQAAASMLFSFPGALARYVLSVQLNSISKTFPYGTFTTNIVATALLGMFDILQRIPKLPGPVGCAMLQGLSAGFCGCMSTISTFVVELQTLKWKFAWRYGFASYLIGQLILLVIMGTSWWAAGIQDARNCVAILGMPSI